MTLFDISEAFTIHERNLPGVDEIASWISAFTREELNDLTIRLLNGCIARHFSSKVIKLPSGDISLEFAYELLRWLPTFEIFLDSTVISSMSDESLMTLQPTISGVLSSLLSPIPISRDFSRNIACLRSLCLLSWHEAYAPDYAKLLADFVSGALVEVLANSETLPLFEYLNTDPLSVKVIFTTVLHLVTEILGTYPDFNKTNDNCEVSERLSFPRKRSLLHISFIYNCTYKSITSLEPIKYPNWVSKVDYPDNFLRYAFQLVHRACRLRDQFDLSTDQHAFYSVATFDRQLAIRFSLAYNLYLTQASVCLYRMAMFSKDPRLRGLLTETDAMQLLHMTIPYYLVAELLLCRNENPNVKNEWRAKNRHIELVSWAIENGFHVRDYALAFLKADCLSDVAYTAEILPRLVSHVPELATDNAVALALISQLSNFRQKLLPTNHHIALLHRLIPCLSRNYKADLLNSIHSKPNAPNTPLPSSNTHFLGYLRNFFNRLVGAEDVEDESSNIIIDLMKEDSRSIVCQDLLLESDLIFLTRPCEFLVELARQTVIRKCAALLPALYEILGHLSYGFDCCPFKCQASSKQDPLLYQVFKPWSRLFSTTEERQTSSVATTDGSDDLQVAAEALQHYLLTNELFAPDQTALAFQASLYTGPTICACSSKSTAPIDGLPITAAKSQLYIPRNLPANEIWVLCLYCLFDWPVAWRLLPKLLTDIRNSWPLAEADCRAAFVFLLKCLKLMMKPQSPLIEASPESALHIASALLQFSTSNETRDLMQLIVETCMSLLMSLNSLPCDFQNPGSLGDLIKDVRDQLTVVLSSDTTGDLLSECLHLSIGSGLPACRVIVQLPKGVQLAELLDLSCFTQRFSGQLFLVSSRETQPVLPSTASGTDIEVERSTIPVTKALCPATLISLFQLASLDDSIWATTVQSISSATSKQFQLRQQWRAIDYSSLLLSVFIVLEKLCKKLVQPARPWARVIGLVDRLISLSLIRLPLRMRLSMIPLIDWSAYRGCFDLFDFTAKLLSLTALQLLSPSQTILESKPTAKVTSFTLACQTLDSLAQRLLIRVVKPPNSVGVSDPSSSRGTVLAHTEATVTEVTAYTASLNASGLVLNSELKNAISRLSLSLELLTNAILSAKIESSSTIS